ncbi:MAG: cobalamin biosynthesis protein CbiD [Candidatus Obscuribacter sp.]|nr:cobalamin biosynthesis protein CbiD [Candidatus Obscuribacter sp.]
MNARVFDLAERAMNGLRRGRTTGSCAAAAVKAALDYLLTETVQEEVNITLPEGNFYLPVPVQSIEALPDGSVKAEVVKMAGDDPDQTDGATIYAIVSLNKDKDHPGVRFFAAEGVGTVTAPGIRVPVGEPAINPVPRRMICQVVEELLQQTKQANTCPPGVDIKIGCVGGEEIAKRTFNPRLGIKGGISILGTTGIVEPMSLAAYQAAIEVYIRVALSAPGPANTVAYLPGNIGLKFARQVLQLNEKQTVHISNFVGYALAATEAYLEETDGELATLYLLGHPGKLAKLLDGVSDTHSQKSKMATSAVAKVAEQKAFSRDLVNICLEANTVEAIIETTRDNPELSLNLWSSVQSSIETEVAKRKLKRIKNIAVRLFDMSGHQLGKNS